MTAEAVASQPLFHSPLGLFDFQADGVARTFYAWTETSEPVVFALWDTGIGKTILALATAALCFEDDKVDVVVVVAEANKIIDWTEVDTPRFTDLTVARYAGSKRGQILERNPQVLVTSWSTGRNDIGTFGKQGRAIVEDGPLTDYLKGKRVAFVFDEASALRSRGTKTYLAWTHLFRVLRKEPFAPRMLALTATSVEKGPEDHWNIGRVLSPERAGRVQDFEPNYVADYDLYGNPTRWKNITRDQMTDPDVMPLNEMFAPITLRKKKTDPDVISQFPARMENSPTLIDLSPAHQRLYNEIEEIFSADDVDDQTQRQGFSLLRLLANHPHALLSSKGRYAQEVIEQVGAAYLSSLGSTKVEAMLEWQARMQDQQTVIFTFFGQSVLPLLHHSLLGADYRVSINHGAMSDRERQRAQDEFKAGETQIFLSSDAGAKGLNLGCGSGLLHYEMPLNYSTFVQRSDRIHRIDSKHPSVTIDALVARNTLEFPLAINTFKKNEMGERVQDADYDDHKGDPGEGVLRAHERLALLRRSGRAR